MGGLFGTLAFVAGAGFAALSNAFDLSSTSSLYARDSSNSTQPSATFFYTPSSSSEVNFTFSLTAVRETGDLFFRLSVPDQYSWVAVGTGNLMQGSLMFVTYANTNGKDLVLSPRIATGHVEPSYNANINLTQVLPPSGDPHPNGIHDDTWNVAAHCKACIDPGNGAAGVDVNDVQQHFIFAFGPEDKNPDSNSLSAPLRRHTAYGYFTMDMTKATVESTDSDEISKIMPPPLGTSDDGASLQGHIENDHEYSSPAHALLMCFVFLLAFPSGILAARVFGSVKLHALAQSLGLLVVSIGMGVGIFISKFYNRSKHVSNGHQVFGLIIVVFILCQWMIGFFHHRQFAKGQPPKTGLFIKIHRILGPIVMAAGVINGAFGFRFALTRWNLVYVPLMLAVIIVLIAIMGIKFLVAKRKGGAPQPEGYGQVPPAYPVYPNAPAPPYSGVGIYYAPPEQPPQSYNKNGFSSSWMQSRSEDNIPLTSMEPERPKQMV